jgi:hypothetical protein
MTGRTIEFPDVTLGMISWRAPETVQHTLSSYAKAGILERFAARRIHFNEISDADRAIAQAFGFEVSGSPGNLGIFGAVDALARGVATPYLLSLENDCPLVATGDELAAMLRSAIADMEALSVPVFILRSRREPGEAFARRERYERKFRPVWPIGKARPNPVVVPNVLVRAYEDRRRSALRGCAIYAEEDPALRHPGVVRRSPNGNWITSSPYLHWTNNAILVRTDFLRDVVLARVCSHPATTTLNGHQDIEAALKRDRWWARLNVPMGQSEPGAFTHKRFDR